MQVLENTHAHTADQLIKALLEAVPDCRAIYRFGSWGSEDERSDSDIDLAILPRSPLDPVRRWDLAQRLASLAGRDVDLVDLLTASTVMRMQVVGHGERLYFSDFFAVEQFDDSVFSAYARLNEERKYILSDIHQRGSVF